MKIKNKALWSVVTLALAVLTVYIVIRSSGMNMSELLAVLNGADKKWMLPGALCSVGIVFFEGMAVLTILRRAGYARPVGRGFVYAAADSYFSAITPSATGGQPGSAFFMMLDGVPAPVTTASLLANLVMYNAAILTIGIACILLRPQLFFHFEPVCRLLILAGIVVLAAMGLVFFGLLWKQQILGKIASMVIAFLTKIRLMRHPEKWNERLHASMIEYKACVDILAGSKKMWITAYLFNLLQRVSQFLVTIFVYLAIGGGQPLRHAASGAASASTSGALLPRLADLWMTQCFVSLGANCVPIPGSMGVTDYLMLDGYLNLMDKQTAYQLQILARGLSFYFCVLLSGVVVLIAYCLSSGTKRKRTR